MLYLLPAFFLLLCGVYSLLAGVLHIAPFKTSSLSAAFKTRRKGNVLTDILDAAAAKAAPFIPMFNVSQIKLSQTLEQAGVSRSPKEYAARLALVFCSIAGAGLLLFFLNQALGILALLAAALVTFILHKDTRESARERTAVLESQLPYFIGLFGASIRHNPDVVDILESYRRNYTDAPDKGAEKFLQAQFVRLEMECDNYMKHHRMHYKFWVISAIPWAILLLLVSKLAFMLGYFFSLSLSACAFLALICNEAMMLLELLLLA